VAWFRRRKQGRQTGGSPGDRPATRQDLEHLEQFVRTRRGVEAFIEPRTTVTETTLLLIAHDGEWTRRRVEGPEAARRFAHRLAIPVYDVALVGYPKRMREYNERRKREAAAARDLAGNPAPEPRRAPRGTPTEAPRDGVG
jgi:hypothetical protein